MGFLLLLSDCRDGYSWVFFDVVGVDWVSEIEMDDSALHDK